MIDQLNYLVDLCCTEYLKFLMFSAGFHITDNFGEKICSNEHGLKLGKSK